MADEKKYSQTEVDEIIKQRLARQKDSEELAKQNAELKERIEKFEQKDKHEAFDKFIKEQKIEIDDKQLEEIRNAFDGDIEKASTVLKTFSTISVDKEESNPFASTPGSNEPKKEKPVVTKDDEDVQAMIK